MFIIIIHSTLFHLEFLAPLSELINLRSHAHIDSTVVNAFGCPPSPIGSKQQHALPVDAAPLTLVHLWINPQRKPRVNKAYLGQSGQRYKKKRKKLRSTRLVNRRASQAITQSASQSPVSVGCCRCLLMSWEPLIQRASLHSSGSNKTL